MILAGLLRPSHSDLAPRRRPPLAAGIFQEDQALFRTSVAADFSVRKVEPFGYDPDHSEAEDYLAWTFGNESCGHVIDQLSDAYNGNPPSNYEDNWIWFDDKPGEEDLNSFIVLFSSHS